MGGCDDGCLTDKDAHKDAHLLLKMLGQPYLQEALAAVAAHRHLPRTQSVEGVVLLERRGESAALRECATGMRYGGDAERGRAADVDSGHAADVDSGRAADVDSGHAADVDSGLG